MSLEFLNVFCAVPDWIHDVQISAVWGPCHLLLEPHIFVPFVDDSFLELCMFRCVVMLQNKFETNQRPLWWYCVASKMPKTFSQYCRSSFSLYWAIWGIPLCSYKIVTIYRTPINIVYGYMRDTSGGQNLYTSLGELLLSKMLDEDLIFFSYSCNLNWNQ